MRLLLIVVLAMLVPVVADAASCPNSGLPGTPYQGFGATTPGGSGKTVYRVTNRADSGPGSLRDALRTGNRCIVFDVAGDIVLKRQLYVEGSFVTVDGFSAPSPGITLRDYGISVWGTMGAHDVILRGLRFRNAGQRTCGSGQCWDGIQVKSGAQRVVIDHVSTDRASDGALDISGSRDVTVQWSIVSGTKQQSLVERSSRISMHHNLFVNGLNRQPQAEWDETLSTRPADTVLDFRNNLLWNVTAYGTIVRRNATANVVHNYYHAPSASARALLVDTRGRAHAAGNRATNGMDVDAEGTEDTAFAVASVATTDACRAAYEVQDHAGARGVDLDPDAVDQAYLAKLPATLPGCAGSVSAAPPASTPPPVTTKKADLVVTSLAMPVTLQRGGKFPIHFGITNRGTTAATNFQVTIYLSPDTSVSGGDVMLRRRTIGALSAGASQSHALTEVIPTSVKAGSYYVVLVIDQAGKVSESNEANNVRVTAATVR
jgi:pectate lyase